MAKTITIQIDMKGKGVKNVTVQSKQASKALNQTSKAAGTADRNIKGVAAASSGASKNFSKMSQGMASGIVPAYATLAANIFALSAAFRFFKEQADLSILKESQVSYAQSSGTAIKTLTANLQEASGGMLTFKSSAEAAAIGMAKGFTPEQMNSLAIGARKVSAALGRDFEDAFDRLVRGVSKAEPELLDELGITLRLANATKRYGDMVGKTADSLTEYERSQAVMVEVQRQLNDQFGDQALQANPYQQLMVTLDNLINKVTQAVLPIFNAIVGTINRSAGAAVAVFGLIGLSILKSMPFIQNFNKGIDDWVTKQKEGYEKAKKALDDYSKKIKDVDAAQSGALTKGQGVAKDIMARGGKGAKSPVLQRFSEGKMKGADKHNLKKAIAAAEVQLAAHGKVVSGIFEGATAAEVKAVNKGLHAKNSAWGSFFRSIGRGFKKSALYSKKFYAGTVKAAKIALGGIGKFAGGVGKLVGKAMAFAGWIGMLKMLWEGWKTLQAKLNDVIVGFLRGIEALMNSGVAQMIKGVMGTIIETVGGGVDWLTEKLGGMVNFLLGVYQKMLEFVAMIPGAIGDMGEAGAEGLAAFRESSALLKGTNIAEYGAAMRENADSTIDLVSSFQASAIGEWTMSIQNSASAALEAEEAYKRWSDMIGTVSEEMITLQDAINAATGVQRGEQVANAMASLNLGSILSSAEMETWKTGDAAYLNDALVLLGDSTIPQVQAAFQAFEDSGNMQAFIARLKELTTFGSMASAGEQEFVNQVESLEEALRNPGDWDALAIQLGKTESAADLLAAGMKGLGEETDVNTRINEAAGGSFKDLQDRVKGFIATQQQLKLDEIDRNKRQETFRRSGTLVAKLLNERLELEKKNAAVQAKLLEIESLRMQIRDGTLQPEALEKARRDLEVNLAQLDQLRAAKEGYERDITDSSKLGLQAINSLGSGLAAAFDGLVMGTKTVKEAFKDMAMGVIQSLSKMLAEMMAAKIMMSVMGFATPSAPSTSQMPASGAPAADWGAFYGVPGGKKGGIFNPPEYARGGISKTLNKMDGSGGYPAILHGTEAVVPLPNGRSIPVDMKGAGNNIVVNISGEGGAMQTEVGDQEGLGRAIAMAVQKELQNQRRSGGILNPYGAA